MIIRFGTLEVLDFDTFLYDLLGTLVCGFGTFLISCLVHWFAVLI